MSGLDAGIVDAMLREWYALYSELQTPFPEIRRPAHRHNVPFYSSHWKKRKNRTNRFCSWTIHGQRYNYHHPSRSYRYRQSRNVYVLQLCSSDCSSNYVSAREFVARLSLNSATAPPSPRPFTRQQVWWPLWPTDLPVLLWCVLLSSSVPGCPFQIMFSPSCYSEFARCSISMIDSMMVMVLSLSFGCEARSIVFSSRSLRPEVLGGILPCAPTRLYSP